MYFDRRVSDAGLHSCSRFYFEVFDINGDGHISREELTSAMIHFLDGDDSIVEDPAFQVGI